MFPVADAVARRYPPACTWALIGANAAAFLYQNGLPEPALERFLLEHALVPARYFGARAGSLALSDYLPFVPFVTSMFLHGGWLHLLLNMWTLAMFGPAVEDRVGALRFLGFYLAAGVAASLAHALVNADSSLPVLGASGAIAGVIGCYVRMFPYARLVMVMPILFVPFFFEVPAIAFAGIWLLTQIVPGIASLALPPDAGGIAWWAHIGGFAAGWALTPLIRRRAYRRLYADEGAYGFLPDGTRSRARGPWA